MGRIEDSAGPVPGAGEQLHHGKGRRRYCPGLPCGHRSGPLSGGLAMPVREAIMQGRILIVGNPEIIHAGAHFLEAATSLGLDASLEDVRQAYAGPGWLRRFNWWLR